MRKVIFIISLTALIICGATYEEILSDKYKQIDVLKKEIEDCRTLLRQKHNAVTDFQKDIDSITTEIGIRNDFLKNYENEKLLSPTEIQSETQKVLTLEADVNRIQDSFKNNIINLYKHGKNYELELLLSAKSPNEYLRRNEYLQKFAQNRKKELRDLKSKKFFIAEKKKLLELSTSSQRFYIDQRRNERNTLELSLSAYNDSLAGTEQVISSSEEKIIYKNSQIQAVQDYINNFVANKKDFISNKYSRLSYSADNFSKLKGMLNLPVDLGLIRTDFGEYINNESETRLTNNGIDFSISKGSRVYVVADGTVSLVGELPFYGKVIIVTHDNDYRSVYASLSETNVNPGDIIHINQIIGKSGETLSGQEIHFELWQGKIPMNPKEWIRMQ